MTQKTAPPPKQVEEKPHADKPATPPAKSSGGDDQETMLWVLGFVILSGFLISVIFGTSGMSTTLVDAETLSTIGNAAVKLLSAAAMLHINLMQLAHALSPKPKKVEFSKMAEAFAYYLVDWTMTFAGFAGWILLATIMSGELGLGKLIFWIFLIALAAGGALLTSWGTEKLARVWLDMYHAFVKATPDYKPLRKGLYSTAGWLGLFVSWGASFFGIVNISVKAGVDMQYMPSAFAVGTAAFLLPLMLSGVEYYLLKVKDRSRGQNLALGLCFLVDGGVIFGGLGGIDLTVEVLLGGVTGPDMAMIATAIVSKAFSAYVGSVGGEKPHIDAANVDKEGSTPSSDAAAAPSAEAHTEEKPAPKVEKKEEPKQQSVAKVPPPQYIISGEKWIALVQSDEDFMPFWDKNLSPDWLAICNVDDPKKPKLIGFVPFDWIPDEDGSRPTPPPGMSYPKEKVTDKLPKKDGQPPEPTYHPVGMTTAPAKKTPPPPPS